MPPVKLSIKEKFILLALDDKKGKLLPNSVPFWMGLTGAVMFEMIDNGHLQLKEQKIIYTEKPTGNNRVYKIISDHLDKHKYPPKIKTLLMELWIFGEEIKDIIVHKLVDKKVLYEKNKRIMGLFSVKRYPLANKIPELRLKKYLKILADDNQLPDKESYVLFRLLNQCDLVGPVFGRINKKKIKKYIQRIKWENDKTEKVSAALVKMEQALFDAIKQATLSILIAAG